MTIPGTHWVYRTHGVGVDIYRTASVGGIDFDFNMPDPDEWQGESVNILLNFTQFFETRIEYRFQIFTAHSCDFLLPSYARLA